MSTKSFITAAEQSGNDDIPPIDFTLDKHGLTAYFPGDGQVAVLMAETSRHQDMRTKVGGAIDFFQSVFDAEEAAWLRNRLLDKDDDFGLPTIQEIIEWLLEEWSANPTQSSSASTRSRNSGGPRSRQRTPAST
jgi:hypothetical protein